MRICFAYLYYDRLTESPRDFMARKIIPVALPQALAARGHHVRVVVLFHEDACYEEGGVEYLFVRSGQVARWISRAARAIIDHRSMLEPAARAVRAVTAFDPDYVHFFGTQLHLNLALLLRALRRTGARTIVHYHSGRPSAIPAARRLQRRNYRKIYRFLFPTPGHARPFLDEGMIPGDRILPLITTSSAIRRGPRQDARRSTGMAGDPVFVWTGRLHPVKDPVTALLGFERIREAWPGAQLYMYFQETTLLEEVRRTIAVRPLLAASVHLRGEVPVGEMEAIYNSADFFLQASLREVSGFAVAEAMAAGAIPVVTDIPSFRSMTADGTLGLLFRPGDAADLARVVLSAPVGENRDTLADRIHDHFQEHLSFPAMAGRLENIYG
jgi:glycosyltransferase involved in cell wall biosynthesis